MPDAPRRRSGDAGASGIEYVAVLLVVAAVLGAVGAGTVAAAPEVRHAAEQNLCRVFGSPDCEPGGGDGEPGDGEPGDGEPGDGEPGDGEPGMTLTGSDASLPVDPGVSLDGATGDDLLSSDTDVTSLSWQELRELGVAPGSVNLWAYLAGGGSVDGSGFDEVAAFFDVTGPDGQSAPFGAWLDSGVSFLMPDGSGRRVAELGDLVDLTGVGLSTLADPALGIDLSNTPLLDLLRAGVAPDVTADALTSWGISFADATIPSLREAGVPDGTLDLRAFIAAGGTLEGVDVTDVADFFQLLGPNGERVPFQELLDAGVSFRGDGGVATRFESLADLVDFTGVPLSQLADPALGIDVSSRSILDFVDAGVVLDVGVDALEAWGITGWEEAPVEASSPDGPVGFENTEFLLWTFLVNGLIDQTQYEQYLADPEFLAGIDDVLAHGGGIAALDSPGQRFVDSILESSAQQLTDILAEPLDLSVGPSPAQILALYALAGTSDRAFQEIAINWLFVQHPELELIFDTDDGSFGFYLGDELQSTPFLDSLIGNLADRGISGDIRDEYEVNNDRSQRGTAACRGECGIEREGDIDDRRYWLSGRFSVRPKFESVNQNRHLDLLVGDQSGLAGVAPIFGLPSGGHGYYVPGDARFGFDIDDNRVGGEGQDLLIRELLEQIDPGFLSGSDYIAFNAQGGTIDGGFGDDFVAAVNSEDLTVNPGGGNNLIVAADGTTLTLQDQHGETIAFTIPTWGLPGSGEGVDVDLVDGSTAYQGTLATSFGADGSVSAEFDESGRWVGQIDEGVTIGVEGGIVSTGDKRDSITNYGNLVGGEDAVIYTGGGDDTFITSPGSTTDVGEVGVGGDDDTIDLAGASGDTNYDLGEGNDLIVIHDTFTGDPTLFEPERSYRYANDDEIYENDQLLFVGDGFSELDPGNPGAGFQLAAEDGTPAATIAFGDDPEHVEFIALVGPDGEIVEEYQSVEPEVIELAPWAEVIADVAKWGGFVSGQAWLSILGAGFDAYHTGANGGGAGDVFASGGVSIISSASGVDFVGPALNGGIGIANGSWDQVGSAGLSFLIGDDPTVAEYLLTNPGLVEDLASFDPGDLGDWSGTFLNGYQFADEFFFDSSPALIDTEGETVATDLSWGDVTVGPYGDQSSASSVDITGYGGQNVGFLIAQNHSPGRSTIDPYDPFGSDTPTSIRFTPWGSVTGEDPRGEGEFNWWAELVRNTPNYAGVQAAENTYYDIIMGDNAILAQERGISAGNVFLEQGQRNLDWTRDFNLLANQERYSSTAASNEVSDLARDYQDAAAFERVIRSTNDQIADFNDSQEQAAARAQQGQDLSLEENVRNRQSQIALFGQGRIISYLAEREAADPSDPVVREAINYLDYLNSNALVDAPHPLDTYEEFQARYPDIVEAANDATLGDGGTEYPSLFDFGPTPSFDALPDDPAEVTEFILPELPAIETVPQIDVDPYEQRTQVTQEALLAHPEYDPAQFPEGAPAPGPPDPRREVTLDDVRRVGIEERTESIPKAVVDTILDFTLLWPGDLASPLQAEVQKNTQLFIENRRNNQMPQQFDIWDEQDRQQFEQYNLNNAQFDATVQGSRDFISWLDWATDLGAQRTTEQAQEDVERANDQAAVQAQASADVAAVREENADLFQGFGSETTQQLNGLSDPGAQQLAQRSYVEFARNIRHGSPEDVAYFEAVERFMVENNYPLAERNLLLQLVYKERYWEIKNMVIP